MRIFLFVIKFFLIGAFFIVGHYNLALSEEGNLKEFGTLYAGWLDSLANNVFSVSSYVVKVEWLPEVGESVFDLNSEKIGSGR